MNIKTYGIIAVALVIAFLAGKYSGPEKVTEKKVVEIKEVIVEKKVLVESKNTTDKSKTVKNKITRPDGTVEESETIQNDISVLELKQQTEETAKYKKLFEESVKITQNSPRFFAGPMLLNSKVGGAGFVKITNNIVIGGGLSSSGYMGSVMIGF